MQISQRGQGSDNSIGDDTGASASRAQASRDQEKEKDKDKDEPVFNFSGFLRDLRTKPAEPIARYLKRSVCRREMREWARVEG
jgi:hypothetical protein